MRTNTIRLADIPLPSTETLERQIIADAISNSESIGEVSLMVTDDSFTSDSRKALWRTIIGMYNAGEHIDMVSVWQKTGQAYIDEIQTKDVVPSLATGFFQHAHLLHVEETKRRAYYAALSIVQQSVIANTSEDDIMAEAESLPKKIYGGRQLNAETPLSSVLESVAEETEAMQEEAMQGRSAKVSSSLPSLDYLLYGGFGRGQLIVLAARPSVGKTALMLQFAKHAAEQGAPATIFSLEMTKPELAKRLLFSTGFVSQVQLAGKNVDWKGFEMARSRINSLPIFINDESRTLESISSRITYSVNQGRCKIAFIDYLSLIPLDRGSKATVAQQIGFVTHELKSIAKRLGIPIVILVQLNRDFAKEGDSSAPQLYHLKDSGDIEQDADVVLMLASSGDNLDLWVRKNRNFKKDVKLVLHPDNSYTSFMEVASPDWVSIPEPIAQNNSTYIQDDLLEDGEF